MRFAAFASVLLGLMLFSACLRSKPERIEHNPAFDAYFSAYTHGEISKHAAIRLRFARDVVSHTGQAIPDDLLRFEPRIAGEASWEDTRTLLFTPHEPLPSGLILTGRLALHRLFPEVEEALREFPFQVKVRDQKIRLSPAEAVALEAEGKQWWMVQGVVDLTDAESLENIQKLVQVKDGKQLLSLQWEQLGPNRFRFRADSVERLERPRAILATYDGSDLDAENEKGKTLFEVPEFGLFAFRNLYRYEENEQYLVLEFSDWLDPFQNLEGLVSLNGKAANYQIEGNRIKVFPKQKMLGTVKVEISANIRSKRGLTLSAPQTSTLTFSEEKPRLRWVGKGNILPRSKSMPVHFQSINLKSVDVRVIKVKEDNVLQFFQVNQIDEDNELKRVGQVVMEKTLILDKTPDLNLGEWTTHSLDLASLLTPEPGAIYEVALGFRPAYVLYPCADPSARDSKTSGDMLKLPGHWDKPNYEYSYWDTYGEDYSYEDIDNPCKPSYYRSEKSIRRNFLGSDLGIVAKSGDQGRLYVVNNLQTTEPMSGVVLEFYDYHQDLIGKATTDKQGMARPTLSKDPFIMIAKDGKQRGYLRLDDGSAMSFSRFDVSGGNYVKGLKGYIYGERGVWRPGDEIFLNFILEDRSASLPAKHPVSLEVKDPRGATVVQRSTTEGVNGVYNFTFSTLETAPTGNYVATVRVGGASFTKNLRIETIKPNRLKMLWEGSKVAYANKPEKLKLQVNWLHGAVAKGLNAKVDATLRKGNATMEQHPGFVFQDPASTYSPQSETIYEGKLDEQGKTQFNAKLEDTKEAMPGPMRLELSTQVFEPGGDFSIDRSDFIYHTYPVYLGVRVPEGDKKRGMLLTDTKHKIEIRSVDPDGKPVANRKVQLKFYKLEWKWWYDGDKNSVPAWRGDVQVDALQTADLTTDAQGRASWDLEVKYPEWGRYLVRVAEEGGHASGQVLYLDWPGWAGRSNDKDPEGAAMLELSADKEVYSPGQEVQISIPTGFEGRALVSIESGNKILQADWVQAAKGTVRYRFQATAEMAPNVYAHVTLLQPHAQTKNDLPIRMYGVLPIRVEDPSTHLEPVIATAQEYRPNQEFSIAVSERKGGPMTYTLAVVDEGLLDLTRFKTPSPWETFYQRVALGVRTWDMYGSVLAAYGGEVKSLLSIGGDGAMNPDAIKQQDRFKPVVLYVGPFELKKGETKNHSFKMPNYVGSVRVMLVAADPKKGAYGQAEQAVPVRQDLMVLATLPRVISAGEKMRIPVTIFTGKDELKEVSLSLDADAKYFKVKGGNTRQVSFRQAGEEMAYFEVETSELLGAGKIRIEAKSGKESTFYEANLLVRHPNEMEVKTTASKLLASKNLDLQYQPTGLAGSNQGGLELSVLPPMNLQKRLKYLIRYPYGCAEQTTSSVFPQLYVGKLTKLKAEEIAATEKNIKAGIARLQTFQTASGGFAYWAGGQVEDFPSNYVGHFLLEAQKAGYTLPSNMLEKWVTYQQKQSDDWSLADGNLAGQSSLVQSYRLYLLALAGKPNLSAMNRLKALKDVKNEPSPVRWHLAAAYFLAGQKDIAQGLAAQALVKNMTFSPADAYLTFGSPMRDQALILQVLTLMNDQKQASGVLLALSERLSSDQWLSTQETAQALVGMSQYAGLEKGKAWSFEYKLGNGEWTKVEADGILAQVEWTGDAKQALSLRSDRELFVQLSHQGLPKVGEESDLSQGGLSMNIVYKDLNGKTIDPSALAQGTEFSAEVLIENKGKSDLHELALHQVFPSGWEIINTRLTGRSAGGDEPEYQDFRDDRVYTFFDLKKGKSKSFRILLNASYAGRYYLPASAVHAMYDRNVQAQRKGQWVEVQNKGTQ